MYVRYTLLQRGQLLEEQFLKEYTPLRIELTGLANISLL